MPSSWAILFPETLNQWELRLIQLAQQARGTRPSPSGVTVVAIDNFSLNQAEQADLSDQTELHQLQQWPWPREIYSLVLNRLFDAGSKAIAIDLLLDSPSLHGPDDDAGLAQQLQRHHRQVVIARKSAARRRWRPQPDWPTQQLLAGSTASCSGAQWLCRCRRHDSPTPSDYGRNLRPTFGENLPDSLATSLLEQAGSARLAAAKRSMARPRSLWPQAASTPTLDVLDERRYAELKDSGAFSNQLILIGPTATVLQDRHNAVFAGPLGMPGVELRPRVANRLEQRNGST